MDLFAYDDYKKLLKAALKKDKTLTLRMLAEKIRIQYTYLSRVLSGEKAHLSEDHLHAICALLKFLPDEIDFIFLLRSLAVSSDVGRQQYLRNKINLYRRKHHLDVPIREYEGRLAKDEADYLFDPFSVLIHVALIIPDYAAHPRRLCSLLGVSTGRLELCIKRLKDLGFVAEENGILTVTQKKIHYGTNHPLMRAHQQLMRSASQAQLLKALEGEKQSFVTTFAANPASVQAIFENFQGFLEKAQEVATKSPAERVYQMQFDLFGWF